MAYVSRDIPVPTSVDQGAAVGVNGLTDKWVQVMGTFVATIDIQVSLDGGTSWDTVATTTTPDTLEVPQSATHVRTDVTAFTSGTPTAILRGRLGRTR